MLKPFTQYLERVMQNTDAYLFVLTPFFLLATPIVQAIQTLLAMRARIISPLLRMQTGRHYATMITFAQRMDATISPHCTMKTDKIARVFIKQDDRIIGRVMEPDSIRKAVGGKAGSLCHPRGRNHEQPRHRHRRPRSVTASADLMEQRGTRHLAVFKGDSIVEIFSVRDLLHPVSIDEFSGFVGNVMKEGSHTDGV